MSQCFIFIKYSNNEGCLSVVLNAQGGIEAALGERSYAEIKQLQLNSQTILVLSSEDASLHQVELPWLAEKKARLALPFALEEKLAENVAALHFAFDRRHYTQSRYLVVVCNKTRLNDLVAHMTTLGLRFDSITLDWFALDAHESCVLENTILVNNELNFAGSLPQELAPRFLSQLKDDQNHNVNQKLYAFRNSMLKDELLTVPGVINLDMDPCLWIAMRLQAGNYINLCQGGLQPGNPNNTLKRLWFLAAGMAVLWLFTVILNNGLSIYQHNKKIAAIDANIARQYRYFFPNASQVISPKFRISQLLKSQKSDADHSFWLLLNTLSSAIHQNNLKNNSSEVQQIQFQNKVMQITLMNKDFNSLEALQSFLKKAGVTVRQSESSSKEDKVLAILELSL